MCGGVHWKRYSVIDILLKRFFVMLIFYFILLEILNLEAVCLSYSQW